MKKLVPVVLALGLSFSAAAAPIFRNPLPFPFSTTGFWNCINADFDGNGHPDVLITDGSEDAKLVVYLSNGSGPFAPPVLTSVPGTRNPGIGDFNGDGRTDVAVPSFTQQTVTVMLGSGDGTFLPGSSFGTVYSPHVVLAGRFNGDQHLDLAVGMTFASSQFVYIYLGDGAGHFSGGQATGITDWLQYYPPVDLNGDNKTDLIGGTRVFLGDGNGGFTAMPAIGIGDHVLAGDFNHDGKRDLASVSSDVGAVGVRLGNGDGTFQNQVSYPTGYTYGSIDAGELNGDGNIDLLVSGYGSAGTVGVLLGNPDGTFQPAVRWLSNPQASLMAAGDFDHDGKVDFVTAIDEELSALSFVRGNGNGTFQTYRAFRPGSNVGGGIPADMNGDGKQDVVVIQEHNGPSEPFDLAVLLNDGSGKLAAPVLSPTDARDWTGIPYFTLGDLDNDGTPDAVVFDNYAYVPRARILLGNGDGTFAAPVPFNIPATGLMKLGHFNGDSNLDLYVDGWNVSTVYPGLGNGTFGGGIQSNIFDSWLFGDLNGDGALDVVTDTSQYKRVGINDGNGHFTSQSLTQDDAEPRALGDFNGDQKLDLLLTTVAGTQVKLGNGNGTFGAPVNVATIPTVTAYFKRPVTVADFDGDGKIDASFGTSVFLGNGDGTFRARARFRTFEADGVHTADMDGNGSPDLVTTTRVPGEIFVLLTRTASDPTATSSVTVSPDKSVAAYAEQVTLTATVTGGAVGLSGAVTFLLDGVPVAIFDVVEGQAKFKSNFAVGGHTVTATYHDENYLSSTASTGLTITKAITTAGISGAPNPRPQGRSVTITTSLSAKSALGWPGPTGTMTLREGATPLPLTLVNNRATISTLSVGSHVISVDYPGDANYEPSTASYTQVITNPEPFMDIKVTPAVVMANSPATFTVDFPFSANVTGSITFSVDGTPQSVVPLQNGVATFQSSFAWGFHTVIARYPGDNTWGETERTTHVNVHAGPWGTPIVIDAQGSDISAIVKFSRITGASSYTLWRKMTFTEPWQVVSIATPDPYWETSFISTIGAIKSALFAVTATDSSGNVSPMSAPALATTVTFGDDLQPNVTSINAFHLTHLRLAIGAVRTFAGLAAYSYSNTIAAGQPIRAADMQELRTALGQARSAIGFPAIPFTDPTLTPTATKIRAAHVMELRAGVN